MKKNITFFIAFFFTCASSTLFAQGDICVTSSDAFCYTGCGPNSFIRDGSNTFGGVVRNTYNDQGSAHLRYNNSTTPPRWEIKFEGNVDFYNETPTHPNPPGLNNGTWVSGGTCGTMTAMSGGVENTPLPIELTRFEGNKKEERNHLTWRTASETDNSHFDIERSIDGSTFRNIGQVKGNNKPSSYQYVDAAPFTLSYYRLKQVDYDGKFEYSKVISITQTGKGKGLKIYPNPVANTLTVEFDSPLWGLGAGDFQILNLLGQQVLTGKTAGQGLDVSVLPQGTYVLKVGAEQAKFIKQ